MNLKKMIAILSLAMGMALAQPPPPGPGGQDGPGAAAGFVHNPLLGYVLEITDAQKKQIGAILDAARTANTALDDQLKTIHDAEQAAVKAGKTDAELAALVTSETPLVNQIHTARLSAEAKVWKVLTAAQKTRLAAIQQYLEANQPGPGADPGPGPGFRAPAWR